MLQSPILVTGAAGRIGGVGGEVVEILRSKGLPVRALVRTEDDRAEALRATGAEVVVGDLTRAEDVARALDGCRRMYFGMSVSAPYLEATVTAAAVARELGDLEVFVNISQLTVSQMSLLAMTDSLQQRLHWLGEQALNWSGLPVVHVRARSSSSTSSSPSGPPDRSRRTARSACPSGTRGRPRSTRGTSRR